MKKLIYLFVVAILLSGCATIVHGTKQYVEIESVPSGASVYVNGNYYSTPAKILLPRGYPMQEYQLLLQKEGYKPGYATLAQSLSGWLWGDIFWGILPGIAVDAITGAAFNLTPQKVTIKLEEAVN